MAKVHEKKNISREVKDGKETIINEYNKFEIDDDFITSIKDYFDDYEYAMDSGVFYDRNDDLYLVEVTKFVDALKVRIENNPDDTEEEEKLLKYFTVHVGHDIYFE
jgi:hypothetical protein